MEKTEYAATGRRKCSVARAVITNGDGGFTINGSDIAAYLKRDPLVVHATEALTITEMFGKVAVVCRASGGGLSGQAGAVRLAVARALARLNEDFRPTLRQNGLLTRDPREVERKKYGRPKARKRFQYSKR
ncbi:MAG TPA: 30S ribosomal protein S9 [candidate division Zixibacteria bacterium]|nr:30S ribosomal protein S9 [candidate division Zixibacteria bacterium]